MTSWRLSRLLSLLGFVVPVLGAGVWFEESCESSDSGTVSSILFFADNLPWRLLSESILAPSGAPSSAPELCSLSIPSSPESGE
jgi:hypothetical protein